MLKLYPLVDDQPAQLTLAHFESGMLSELLQRQRLVIPQNSKKLAFLQRQLSSLLITLQCIQATLQKQTTLCVLGLLFGGRKDRSTSPLEAK